MWASCPTLNADPGGYMKPPSLEVEAIERSYLQYQTRTLLQQIEDFICLSSRSPSYGTSLGCLLTSLRSCSIQLAVVVAHFERLNPSTPVTPSASKSTTTSASRRPGRSRTRGS